MANQPLMHIFKPGPQTTAAGADLEFSNADLTATASAYDPALHEAPICIGHPKDNLPAYGWVSGLQASAAGLHAARRQVDPHFAEMVRAGKFKKVSAAFYAPDSKANPVPGVYYLRHVAFLGAQPPAVKGLAPIEFSDAEDGVLTFAEMDFSEGATTVARLFRGLRDFLIGQFGQDRADQVLPSWDLGYLEDIARRESADPNPVPAFSEAATNDPTETTQEPTVPEPTAREKELQSQLDAANAQLNATREADAKAKREQREADAIAFAEGLVNSNQLLPKDKATVTAALVAVEGDQPVEFGEGEDKKPLGPALRKLLQALPTHSLNGEHIAGKGHQAGVDANDPNAIAAKAVEFQEAEARAGRHVTTAMAVDHVMKG